MVIRENITINGREFIRNYSDSGYMIERDGVRYGEAIDPIEYSNERIYTETDELIPVPPEDLEEITE